MTSPYILPGDGDNEVKVEFLITGKDPSNVFDPIRLLAEWHNWWLEQHTPPSEVPNSLHNKTARVLSDPRNRDDD